MKLFLDLWDVFFVILSVNLIGGTWCDCSHNPKVVRSAMPRFCAGQETSANMDEGAEGTKALEEVKMSWMSVNPTRCPKKSLAVHVHGIDCICLMNLTAR